MRVTFNRFDTWFTKGFDGLRNLLLDRANATSPAKPELKAAVEKLLLVIDSVAKVEDEMPEEVNDDLLAEVTNTLAQFLECRIRRGKLYVQSQKDVLNLYHPLQTALARLENGNEPS